MRRIVLLGLVIATSQARAEPPGLTPLAPPGAAPAATESYRLQTLTADGLAFGLLVLGAAQHGDSGQPIALAGTALFAFGGPGLHLYHHRTSRAATSLAMRVGLPVLGGFVGYHVGPRQCYYADAGAPPLDGGGSCGDSGSVAGAILGVLAGAVTASILDIGLLSKADEVAPAPTWSPMVAASAGAWSLGVTGAF